MITQIRVDGLRGILAGELRELTSLTVLVGPNGCGKSTILDGLLIGASPDSGAVQNQIASRRPPVEGQRWLLWQGELESATITVRTDDQQVRECQVSLTSPRDPNASLQFRYSVNKPNRTGQPEPRPSFGPPPNALDGIGDVRVIDPRASGGQTPFHDLYSRTAARGAKRDAESVIASLLPGFNRIEILTERGKPALHAFYEGYSHPVELLGDGIRLLLRLSLELASPKGSFLMLEEPEVQLHPAAIRNCAKVIWAAVRHGTQVVLTTHSLDMIDSLIGEATDAELSELSMYRLALRGGELSSSRLNGSEVALARTSIEEDLR